jgi:hypothetical protein
LPTLAASGHYITYMMILLMAVLVGLSVPVSPKPSTSPPLAAHGGMTAQSGQMNMELVVGPERIALFTAPQVPGDTQVILLGGTDAEPVTLKPQGDHFEAPNSFGIQRPLQLVAVVQDRSGARVARFDFVPGQGSTFHDHRPFHGGYVGMTGDRHIEIALVSIGTAEAEIQLYLSDAYRQPLPVEGAHAELTFADGAALSLRPLAGGLVGRIPRPRGALDTHVTVTFAGDQKPEEMDFYIDPQNAAPGPSARIVEIHVSDNGFVPAHITATAGKAMTLRFLRTSAHTCATEVLFPEQGITRELPLGQAVDVALIPHKGEIDFSCGMRMFKGQIVAR